LNLLSNAAAASVIFFCFGVVQPLRRHVPAALMKNQLARRSLRIVPGKLNLRIDHPGEEHRLRLGEQQNLALSRRL
jgi:hypothetical protein